MRRNCLVHCFATIGLLAGTTAGWAQVPSAFGSPNLPGPPGSSGSPSSSSSTTSSSQSLLTQAPGAPVIRYSSGMLTIEATNSSLRAILDSLGKQTGTTVQGLIHDERIFGIYGPGNPQEVLASLLDDSGYNVLISGKSADGAPREIVLTASSTGGGAASGSQGGNTQAADENDEDATDSGQVQPPQPGLFAPQPQPQQGQPGAPSPQQVKTPQQLLEELQRLRLGSAANGAPQP